MAVQDEGPTHLHARQPHPVLPASQQMRHAMRTSQQCAASSAQQGRLLCRVERAPCAAGQDRRLAGGVRTCSSVSSSRSSLSITDSMASCIISSMMPALAISAGAGGAA